MVSLKMVWYTEGVRLASRWVKSEATGPYTEAYNPVWIQAELLTVLNRQPHRNLLSMFRTVLAVFELGQF